MEMDPENIEAVIHQRYGVPEGENSGPSLRFPPGFNFNPNDQELIRLYLDRKIKGEPLLYNVFKDVNLYDYDPEELVGNYELSGEEKFYFFTSRTRKYPNGSRPARAAGGGYWKATGSEKKIYNDDDELVGVKKTLVYYRGKAKENDGVKTDWIMQEYISEITTCKPGDSMKLDDWVLCCIHKKRGAIDNPHKLQNVSQAQSDMPTEQDAKNNQSYQTFIDSNGGYDNAIMVQRLVAAPVATRMQMTEFNGMFQPSAIAPSGQMIDFNRRMPQLGEAYAELMDNHDCMVQKSAISPTEPMTDFNYMAPRFAAAPIEQMMGFYDMTQLSEIADFNAMRQPSPPMTEHNGIMSICNNHSTGQGFQQNLSNAMISGKDHVDQFGMAYGERDEVIGPMKLLCYEPAIEIDDVLSDSIEPKELDADERSRHDVGCRHAEDFRNYELSREEKFYFFTSRTRKYPNGSRPACTAGGGYWKAKGSEKKNYSDDELVGVKKTLVYYRGKAKKNGVKTDWTMQEYISEITTCKPGDSMKDFQELRITIQKRQEDAAASLNNLWMEDAPENSDGSEKEITWRKHNPSHWVAQWKLIFLWRVLL
ncbi:uncharacterized protein [Elaeis guineensis]|uniref:uncharacterized protein isoform X2 n=1 Tax=Elaeis guineensis var. tenera TaxID=51953 RepID=UPI003C6DA3D6